MADLRCLPVDLYQPIVSFVEGNHDLLTLCVTCREWWFESHRALFRHVKLRGGTRLKSWTRTVLNNPCLAALTYAITLPTRASLIHSEKVALAEALSSVVNLQELYITHAMTIGSLAAYLDPWILERCSKELKFFHNELEEFEAGFEALSTFFRSHSQISRLYWAGCTTQGYSIDRTILHDLTRVHLKAWRVLDALVPRSISRIRIEEVPMTQATIIPFATSLSQFKDTLTHLSFRIKDVNFRRGDCSIAEVVHLLGRSIPNLNFLNISGDIVLQFDTEMHRDTLAEALSTLQELDTVMFDSRTSHLQCLSAWGRCYPLDVCGQGFAKTFMDSCPRLKRVALGPLPAPCGRDGKRSYCYGRGPDGRVKFEGFDILTPDAWAIV